MRLGDRRRRLRRLHEICLHHAKVALKIPRMEFVRFIVRLCKQPVYVLR